jgi:hypothetical protein
MPRLYIMGPVLYQLTIKNFVKVGHIHHHSFSFSGLWSGSTTTFKALAQTSYIRLQKSTLLFLVYSIWNNCQVIKLPPGCDPNVYFK